MLGPPEMADVELLQERYELQSEIASGGMATVYHGRVLGAGGFTRQVAIKRLHPQYAKEPEFVVMFMDEARIAARIRHRNVVPTLDVVMHEGELFLVMVAGMASVSGAILGAYVEIGKDRDHPLYGWDQGHYRVERMADGPALALLLAGPALSLPNMLVIRSVLGTIFNTTPGATLLPFKISAAASMSSNEAGSQSCRMRCGGSWSR